jgi:hypothetical protein
VGQRGLRFPAHLCRRQSQLATFGASLSRRIRTTFGHLATCSLQEPLCFPSRAGKLGVADRSVRGYRHVHL